MPYEGEASEPSASILGENHTPNDKRARDYCMVERERETERESTTREPI